MKATIRGLLLISSAHAFMLKPPTNSIIEAHSRMEPLRAVADGSVVTVECQLIPEGDFVPEPLFDGIVTSEDDPPVSLEFVVGQGNYLPGLHEVIRGMEGEGSEVQGVSMDAGWGERRSELVATIPFGDSGIEKSQIEVGTQLMLQGNVPCRVTEVGEDNFTIDANPLMAGASYSCNLKLLKTVEGPKIEEFREAGCEGDYEVATFALGCFWGGELAFMRESGVVGTGVGYTQGELEDPTYEQVCSGSTGHTEAITVTFNKNKVSYERLCELAMDRLGDNKFLKNQVGNDRGTQYRHGIYFHNKEQQEVAERIVSSYGEKCETECLPATKFYMAEDYHQQYLLKGGQSAVKEDKTTIRCYG